MSIVLIVQIIALICLFVEAFRILPPPPARPAWGWLGLALWLASLMISGVSIHTTAGGH